MTDWHGRKIAICGMCKARLRLDTSIAPDRSCGLDELRRIWVLKRQRQSRAAEGIVRFWSMARKYVLSTFSPNPPKR